MGRRDVLSVLYVELKQVSWCSECLRFKGENTKEPLRPHKAARLIREL